MAGENNNDELVAQLQQQIKDLEAEIEKQKGIADNAEKKFQEWAAERGKERKAVGEIAEGMAEELKRRRAAEDEAAKLRESLAEAGKALAEAKVKGPTPKSREDQKTVQDQIAEIEGSLTDDQLKAMDQAHDALDDAKRKLVDESDEGYLEFLRACKRNVKAPDEDLPRWRKKPAQPKPDRTALGDALDKVFGQKKRSAGNIPDGPDAGGDRTRRQREVTGPAKTTKILAGWG